MFLAPISLANHQLPPVAFLLSHWSSTSGEFVQLALAYFSIFLRRFVQPAAQQLSDIVSGWFYSISIN